MKDFNTTLKDLGWEEDKKSTTDITFMKPGENGGIFMQVCIIFKGEEDELGFDQSAQVLRNGEIVDLPMFLNIKEVDAFKDAFDYYRAIAENKNNKDGN